MDKITKITETTKENIEKIDKNQSKDILQEQNKPKMSNPIKRTDNTVLKNLAKFTNEEITKKFGIKDLLR